LDAAGGKPNSKNATVSDVKTGETISFTRLDDAMPWPVGREALASPHIPGFAPFDELSRYELKVVNLKASKYAIAIDGISIGTFSNAELANGINLSAQASPAMHEGEKLFNAILAKNSLYHLLWYDVKIGQLPDWVPLEAVAEARAAKVKALEADLEKAEATLDSLRQPQAHRWTLTPAP